MVAVWESCGSVLLVDLFRSWGKYVNRDIPSQQISTETYKELKWAYFAKQGPGDEKNIHTLWSVHNAKLHFKMSEKKETKTSMFAMLVHKPFASGKTLWVLSQINFVSFTLPSPGHTQLNIFTWLAVFMPRSKEPWSSLQSSVCSVGNVCWGGSCLSWW